MLVDSDSFRGRTLGNVSRREVGRPRSLGLRPRAHLREDRSPYAKPAVRLDDDAVDRSLAVSGFRDCTERGTHASFYRVSRLFRGGASSSCGAR